MSDSLAKLARGLDARQRLRAGLAASPLNGLINTPRTVSAIADMRASAALKATRYREWSTKFRDRLGAFEAKKIEEAEKIPGLTKLQRADIVRLAVASERERLLSEGGPDAQMYQDRERIRAELVETRTKLVAVKADYESDIGALMRATLGSDRRRAFAADVATAGPQELDGYLREAIKRGGEEGKALAAAVFARMDELAEKSPDVRSRVTISKAEVAGLLIGAECRSAVRNIEGVEILHEEISQEAVELQGGRVSQVARDALRMRRHNFAEQFPEEKPKPEEE